MLSVGEDKAYEASRRLSVSIRYWSLLLFGFVTMTLFALMQALASPAGAAVRQRIVPNKTGVIYNDLTSSGTPHPEVTAYLHTHGGIGTSKYGSPQALWAVQQILSQATLYAALCPVRCHQRHHHPANSSTSSSLCFTPCAPSALQIPHNSSTNTSQARLFFHTNRWDSLGAWWATWTLSPIFHQRHLFQPRDLISVFVHA
jgi:hypothetical protein